MNRDDIIRMAREAHLFDDGGVWFSSGLDSDVLHDDLERFANLVAAAERKRCYDLIETLVKAEREACARVCEGRANGYQYATDPYAHEHITEANYCAAAIRARGEE